MKETEKNELVSRPDVVFIINRSPSRSLTNLAIANKPKFIQQYFLPVGRRVKGQPLQRVHVRYGDFFHGWIYAQVDSL